MESKRYISQAKGFGFSKDTIRWTGNTPYTTKFYTVTDGSVWVKITKTRTIHSMQITLEEFLEKFYLIK